MEVRAELYLGDSKEELKKLADNSVDLIVTSPPYADQSSQRWRKLHI
jgi:DNA modification methylase